VDPAAAEQREIPDRAERFLAAGARSLAALAVPATTTARVGPVVSGILAQMAAGQHDLLVLGAPLPALDGRVSLADVVGPLIRQAQWPVLIVRSDRGGG